MGMRPLYYHHTPERTLIASEIQQLLATGDVAAEIHEPAVARYLIGEFGVPDETFYRGVRRSGRAIVARGRRGGAARRFWDVDPDAARALRRARRTTPSASASSSSAPSRTGCGRRRPGGPLPQRRRRLRQHRRGGGLAARAGARGRADARLQLGVRHPAAVRRAAPERPGRASATASRPRPRGEASAPLARYPEHGPHRDEPYIGATRRLLEAGLAAAATTACAHVVGRPRRPRGGRLVADYLDWLRRGAGATSRTRCATRRPVPGRERGPACRGRPPARPRRRAVAAWRWRGRARPPAPRRASTRGDPPGCAPTSWRAAASTRPRARRRAARRRSRARPAHRYGLVFVPMHMRGMVWSERTNAAFGLGFVDPWSDRRLAEFVAGDPAGRRSTARASSASGSSASAMRGVMPEELRERGQDRPEPAVPPGAAARRRRHDPRAADRHGGGAARLPRRRRAARPLRGVVAGGGATTRRCGGRSRWRCGSGGTGADRAPRARHASRTSSGDVAVR
jgi:asparagine synthase (glutamine-hydrolysing)